MTEIDLDNKKMWESIIDSLRTIGSQTSDELYADLVIALKKQGLAFDIKKKEIVPIESEELHSHSESNELTEEDLQSDFETEITACSLRYPEVSFAKMSRIAKRFYDLGRDSVLDEEKELAYKTRDAIQYHDGYCNAIASARAIVEKHFSSFNVYDSCIGTLRDDILRELSDCIGVLDKGE